MGNIQKRAMDNRYGIQTSAHLRSSSPNLSNSQVFNLNFSSERSPVAPAPQTTEVVTEEPKVQDIPVVYGSTPEPEPNPYDNISKVDDTVQILNQQLSDKDCMINALSLIIEILESNPIIVNKWVIADDQTLRTLIKYLTDADDVDIKIGDIDCGCTRTKYVNVESIYVIKDGQAQNFKYACPNACRILDNHHISTSLVW